MGTDAAWVGNGNFMSSSPFEISKTRRLWSPEAEININPDFVTSGPPKPGEPLNKRPITGMLLSKVPSGTCQSFSPLDKSTAANVAHGGGEQGAPSGEASKSISTQYGVPVCGNSCPEWPQAFRGRNVATIAACVSLATMMPRSGSTAGDPQLLPPMGAGYSTVPAALIGV